MAAKKSKPPKGKAPKKGLHGKIPSKRSINLILVDENKINPLLAALGIVLIVALAAVFSKFMVLDRLNAMIEAQTKASRIRAELDEAQALISEYGDVENTYAHYTYAGMSAAELSLIDRNQILALVATMLPAGETALNPQGYVNRLLALFEEAGEDAEEPLSEEEFQERFWNLLRRIVPRGYVIHSWSVNNNLLNVSVNGSSLQRLNRLARTLEQEAIVDSCVITTASKGTNSASTMPVAGNMIVYLKEASES